MKEQSSPPPARSRRVLWGILLPVLLVGGWFAVTAAVRRHVDEVIQAAVGVPLPDFRLPRLGAEGAPAGGEVAAADLRGRRVVLHFFRSFCSSCDLVAGDPGHLSGRSHRRDPDGPARPADGGFDPRRPGSAALTAVPAAAPGGDRLGRQQWQSPAPRS